MLKMILINLSDDLGLFYILASVSEFEVVITFVKGLAHYNGNVPQMTGCLRSCDWFTDA